MSDAANQHQSVCIDSFDREILECMFLGDPYGPFHDEDVFPQFGMNVQQFRERFSRVVEYCDLACPTDADFVLLACARRYASWISSNGCGQPIYQGKDLPSPMATKDHVMNARIGLGQLRNSAAYYFDRVAAGESFDVVRRGRMVAQIDPPSDAGLALEASVEPCLREVPLAAEDHRTRDSSVLAA